MVENFKVYTIQSDEQVDKIIDSEEYVDARSWLRNDSDEQVNVISDSEKLVVGGRNPKKRSKCNYSHCQHNFSYSHYEQNFNTNIINQSNHPSRCRTDYPARHRWCGAHAGDFETAPDGSPAGKRHGQGVQLCAYLLDSWEGKWHRKGRCHAKGLIRW